MGRTKNATNQSKDISLGSVKYTRMYKLKVIEEHLRMHGKLQYQMIIIFISYIHTENIKDFVTVTHKCDMVIFVIAKSRNRFVKDGKSVSFEKKLIQDIRLPKTILRRNSVLKYYLSSLAKF